MPTPDFIRDIRASAGHQLLWLPGDKGVTRVFTLLHDAKPLLINLGDRGSTDIASWANRVKLVEAKYDGAWELPAIGTVAAPTAVLIRPDGYVAWLGEGSPAGLIEALTKWFGPRSS